MRTIDFLKKVILPVTTFFSIIVIFVLTNIYLQKFLYESQIEDYQRINVTDNPDENADNNMLVSLYLRNGDHNEKIINLARSDDMILH